MNNLDTCCEQVEEGRTEKRNNHTIKRDTAENDTLVNTNAKGSIRNHTGKLTF
jgi:hypothetical protein